MANSTTISKTGAVAVSDIQAVLGVTAPGIVALCSSAKINKWSLCKPMKHPTLHDITDAERKEGNFGFSFGSQIADQPGYSSLVSLKQAIEEGTAWKYLPPNGDRAGGAPGLWQPCRMGDWRGYDHEAKQFVKHPGDIGFNPDRREYIFLGEKSVLPVAGLRWTDMSAINGKYLCVAVLDMSSPTPLVGYKTSGTAFGATEPDVTLKVNTGDADLTLTANKEYEYLLCACSVMKTSFMAVVSGNPRFFPIPAEPDLTGILKYSPTIEYLKFSVVGVAGDQLVEGGMMMAFDDPKQYAFATVDETPKYLGVGTAGRIALLIKVENTDTSAHETSSVSVLAAPTLAAESQQSEAPQIFAVEAESDSVPVLGNEVDKIAVGASSSAMFVLYCDTLLRTADSGSAVGSVPAGTSAFVTFTIGWNSAAQSMNTSIYVKA